MWFAHTFFSCSDIKSITRVEEKTSLLPYIFCNSRLALEPSIPYVELFVMTHYSQQTPLQVCSVVYNNQVIHQPEDAEHASILFSVIVVWSTALSPALSLTPPSPPFSLLPFLYTHLLFDGSEPFLLRFLARGNG